MATGACGISCDACGLYAKGICQGCVSGDICPPEVAQNIPCPILKCAAEKKIPYCSRDCNEFPCKLHDQGYPYSSAYLGMYRSRNVQK
ncbi:MAG TPA: DUF3795 domain-containing protein [Pseudobacteroides sp.]|nr:DUF3795 domain-containing protein [Pseudobacteroides sp.]